MLQTQKPDCFILLLADPYGDVSGGGVNFKQDEKKNDVTIKTGAQLF